ncbi:hypothetical protein [Catenovulum adriaticum]|uniref:DoxX-like protein n=1 Tax=Catenovulum adriaticum TaxID=2984846 RepID=A0ABY7AQE0_9ALTE|nr:hypothetical protein [Catenovulum sp. TS8]WAJ71694.1 hypothetical protein OLW01_15245 [Catenovulum sp. TS8]
MDNSTQISQQQVKSIQISLFALRLGVFIVMFVWMIDKFINPSHNIAIFKSFYAIDGLSISLTYVIGIVQAILVFSFLAGFKKRISYGLIFILHGASTLFSFPRYLEPFDNMLFFAAWPMWAACFALYLLRDLDTLFTVRAKS